MWQKWFPQTLKSHADSNEVSLPHRFRWTACAFLWYNKIDDLQPWYLFQAFFSFFLKNKIKKKCDTLIYPAIIVVNNNLLFFTYNPRWYFNNLLCLNSYNLHTLIFCKVMMNVFQSISIYLIPQNTTKTKFKFDPPPLHLVQVLIIKLWKKIDYCVGHFSFYLSMACLFTYFVNFLSFAYFPIVKLYLFLDI